MTTTQEQTTGWERWQRSEAWRDHALFLTRKYGYAEARRRCVEAIDNNSMGTATSAFHTATLKQLDAIQQQLAGAVSQLGDGT
jgi:hypothetical protein